MSLRPDLQYGRLAHGRTQHAQPCGQYDESIKTHRYKNTGKMQSAKHLTKMKSLTNNYIQK